MLLDTLQREAKEDKELDRELRERWGTGKLSICDSLEDFSFFCSGLEGTLGSSKIEECWVQKESKQEEITERERQKKPINPTCHCSGVINKQIMDATIINERITRMAKKTRFVFCAEDEGS
ncbi:hypothetical protein [Chlamydiifrater volucris]|uniref:hypothetical protein n=1 Tax=Chlamydiifrater volucris TaxID=2681470 RepID=UPI001BD11C7F|nr:hypothetical protein [Chlamydiifrater volucris]